MKAAKVTFPDKLAGQFLYHEEVNALKAALNQHADLLDNPSGAAQLYQGLTLPAAQAVLTTAPPTVVPGLLYGITGDWNSTGTPATVYVVGLNAGAFSVAGVLLSGGTYVPVVVNVAAGTAVAATVDAYTKAQTNALLAGYVTAAQLAALIGAAPAALDTLAEIAAQLQADESGAAAMLATLQQHTQQLTDLQASLSNAQLTRIQSGAYFVDTDTEELTGYASLQEALLALDGSEPVGTLFVTRALASPSVSGDWIGTLLPYLTGDAADALAVSLGTGARLFVQTVTRLNLIGAGTVVLAKGGSLRSSRVDKLVLQTPATGSTSFRLADAQVLAWSNPGGGQATVTLIGKTTIPAGALPAGLTLIDRRDVTSDDARLVGGGGGASVPPQELQFSTPDSNNRVSVLALTDSVTLLSAQALAGRNCQALSYQVNTYDTVHSAWLPGAERTSLADTQADLAALTADQYAHGAELLFRVSPVDASKAARGLVKLTAPGRLVMPSGTRASLRQSGSLLYSSFLAFYEARSSGNTPTSWKDLSGNGRDLSLLAGSYLLTTDADGRPVYRNQGPSAWSVPELSATAADYTFYFLVRPNDPSYGFLFDCLPGGRLILPLNGSEGAVYYGNTWHGGNNPVAVSQRMVLTWRLNSATGAVLRHNNTNFLTTTYAPVALTGLTALGRRSDGNEFPCNLDFIAWGVSRGNDSDDVVDATEKYLLAL